MSSDTSICNRALQAAGTRSTIASLTEDSNEAINCNMIFADTRDELLGMAFWNFARKTAVLGLLKSAPGTPSNPSTTANNWTPAYPAPPWLYEYAYPSDCLTVRQVVQQIQNYYVGIPITSNGMGIYPYFVGPGAPFLVATDTDDTGAQINVILTSQYQAIGTYTMRVTDPNLFSANFVQALVIALAAKLAIALTGDLAKSNTLFAQANAFVVSARAQDGNEGLTVIDNMPDYITCRSDGFGEYAAPNNYIGSYGALYGVV